MGQSPKDDPLILNAIWARSISLRKWSIDAFVNSMMMVSRSDLSVAS